MPSSSSNLGIGSWWSKLAAAAALAGAGMAAEAGQTVSFVGATWSLSGADKGFFHAFLCIDTLLNQGIKSDCYGFYPSHSKKALIGGPGKIQNLDIIRIGADVVSTKPVALTDAQRTEIFKRMKDWSAKNYLLTDENCIDFVKEVIDYLGLSSPTRGTFQTPQQFIKKVAELNKL